MQLPFEPIIEENCLHNNIMKYKYLHCNFKLVSWEAVVKVAWLLNDGSENGC